MRSTNLLTYLRATTILFIHASVKHAPCVDRTYRYQGFNKGRPNPDAEGVERVEQGVSSWKRFIFVHFYALLNKI